MSKAFVIKNKEGKYSKGEFDSNDNEIFTENLIYCEHYFEEVYAQNFCPKDCEVVEITIAEGDLEKEIEYWHNLFKQKEQQFQGVRERYHLLNRLQANYDKKDKLHLSEMQCLELVEKNEKLEQENKQLKQQLVEKDKDIEALKEHIKFLENKCLNEINVKLVNVTKEKIQEIRKQVCDRVNHHLDNLVDEANSGCLQYLTIDLFEFQDFLERVEQGE